MINALWLLPLVAAMLSIPRWPWSRAWGYIPCVGLALIALGIFALHRCYVI